MNSKINHVSADAIRFEIEAETFIAGTWRDTPNIRWDMNRIAQHINSGSISIDEGFEQFVQNFTQHNWQANFAVRI